MTQPGFNIAITDQNLVVFEYHDDRTDFQATLTPDAAKELGKTLVSRGDKARAVKSANANPEAVEE